MTATNKNHIPHFASIQEEAEFWDTHDTTDYETEFKPIKVQFAKRLSEGITIRFAPDDLIEIRRRASKKGVGATTLVRMWVREHLAQ